MSFFVLATPVSVCVDVKAKKNEKKNSIKTKCCLLCLCFLFSAEREEKSFD